MTAIGVAIAGAVAGLRHSNAKSITIVLITQKTTEMTFKKALDALKQASCIDEVSNVIRVEK